MDSKRDPLYVLPLVLFRISDNNQTTGEGGAGGGVSLHGKVIRGFALVYCKIGVAMVKLGRTACRQPDQAHHHQAWQIVDPRVLKRPS